LAIASALFSTASAEWETPPELFALLHREFAFTLDVCATRKNRKCPNYFTREDDGLRQTWRDMCWMNPPYGRLIGVWVEKARCESTRTSTVVSLLPARTDTSWWHDHVMNAREIRLLRGRLTFVGATSPAPFPSAVVIFGRAAKTPGTARVVGWDWKSTLHVAARKAA
jgi:phage N-6-adenine-methyltransferase